MQNGNSRVLLVHPLGYSAKNASNDVSRMANIMPPLGLASISAYLGSHTIKNDIVDCYAHPDSDELIIEYFIDELEFGHAYNILEETESNSKRYKK